VVVNPENNRIYVSNHFSDNISIIDGTTNSVVESVTVIKPFEMAINTNTGIVYVTYSESGPLSIISESVNVQDSSIQLNSIIITVIILVAAGILASILVSKRKAQRLNN
jgi:YVTN family beta-propeller protein